MTVKITCTCSKGVCYPIKEDAVDLLNLFFINVKNGGGDIIDDNFFSKKERHVYGQ